MNADRDETRGGDAMRVEMVEASGPDGGGHIGARGIAAFRRDGLLVIRGLIAPEEIEALRHDTAALIEEAERGGMADCTYRTDPESGERQPFRIDYVVARSPACRRLMGHPFIRRSMEALFEDEIVQTWDSMVFKREGRGARIAWHRDQRRGAIEAGPLAVNVDFYLDDADATTCLRGVPGSQAWSDGEAQGFIDGLGADEFAGTVAAPLPMRAGDVLLHDVFVLHGSPESRSALRRVLYYEFRSREGERRHGPHDERYVALKDAAFERCCALRDGRASDEGTLGEPLEALRVPHEPYWRADSDFRPGQLTAP